MNDWISVEQKMPQEAGYYLVFLRGRGSDGKGMSINYCHPAEFAEGNPHFTYWKKVTHWMYLPEPPASATQTATGNSEKIGKVG